MNRLNTILEKFRTFGYGLDTTDYDIKYLLRYISGEDPTMTNWKFDNENSVIIIYKCANCRDTGEIQVHETYIPCECQE